jgi:antitoxin MazE
MTTLVNIGNSKGVRIPKAIIEQAKLNDKELEFKVLEEGLLIKPVIQPRQGWKERFDKASKSGIELTKAEKEWLESSLVEDEDWEW